MTATVLGIAVSLAGSANAAGAADKPAKASPPKPQRLMAVAMHPMWLIIKEDTVCAERTPPWGAPSIEHYAKRLSRNLHVLETAPRARLNYDFSAAELTDVKAMYPDLAGRIESAIRRGQLALVNGTYSQPHLHTLSLEASVRQFAMGTRTILDDYGYHVRTYAMQEPGFTDQTPQILKAFGYRYAHRCIGPFPTRQQALPGQTLTGKEVFCSWRGLDGTEILAWQPGAALHTDCPDMSEYALDPRREYVAFDPFLEKLAERRGTTGEPKIRMFVPWGYIEGTGADELSRFNTAAETALAQMETLTALARPISLPEPGALWKTWLLAQHHDAYWTGAPELRAKSCGWLREAIHKASAACSAILKATAPDVPGGRQSLVLFAVYPRPHRGVARAPWSGRGPKSFRAAGGKTIPAQVIPGGPDQGKLLVPFDCAGAGPAELIADETPAADVAPQPIAADGTFSNKHFAATFAPDGSLKSLRTAQGKELLAPEGPAGALSATVDGKPRRFQPTVPGPRLWKGPVADVLESPGSIGPVPVTRRLLFYHDLPWFEMEVQCDFHNTTLGDFYDDRAKLALQWPLADDIPLVQGIGGASVPVDEPGTAFYPVNWLDLARGGPGGGGLAVINFGALKHVRRDRKLYVVLAWGGQTARFGNRVFHNNGNWMKRLDLRLHGRQLFRFAFYPHDGDWRRAAVPDVAMALLRPPLTHQRACPPHAEPTTNVAFALDGNLIPTSLAADGNRIVCRAYEPYGQRPEFRLRCLGSEVTPQVRDVAGNPAAVLRPWGIINLVVEQPGAK